jgi:ATP-dependent Clp protease protease subunit
MWEHRTVSIAEPSRLRPALTQRPGLDVASPSRELTCSEKGTAQPALPIPSALHFGAMLAPVSKSFVSPRFQGAIHNDYSVEIRGDVPLNAYSVSQLQQGMLVRDLKKAEEPSSLKFYMGLKYSDGFELQDQAALADSLALLSRPVDVIIKSGTTADALMTILSATGKRFIYQGAKMYMGSIETEAGYRKNKDFQVRRELFNEYVRDLETLVMARTGETDRQKVFNDLHSERDYNALQALYYGKEGLVDGILVGHDKVITRKDLNAFYKSKGWSPTRNQKLIEAFNKNYMNVNEVIKFKTTALAEFSPQSLPSADNAVSPYQSLAELSRKEEEEFDKMMSGPDDDEERPGNHHPHQPSLQLDLDDAIETDQGIYARVHVKSPEIKPPMFHFITPKGSAKTPRIPLNGKALPFPKYMQMEVDYAPPKPRNVLDDDVIFFNDAFMDSTAEQIADALLALDAKKNTQKTPSHIKILENSPGGSVWSGQELRSTIRSLKNPVDVIVQGMGASCGSWLLCSATGNRYATPNARIMIHEAATAKWPGTGQSFNETADSLHQATVDYVQIVADATGRPVKDVWADFKLDVWFNPLESLVYGKKGLIDGILVGPDKVITRQDVENYLAKQLGGKRNVQKYIDKKILEKREPKLSWRPEEHDENDPFENPLKVIRELTSQAKPLSAYKKFKASVPPEPAEPFGYRNINYFNVVPKIFMDLDFDDDD